MEWLILLAVIGGGSFLAFRGWVWFTDSAAEAEHRRELAEIEQGPTLTPDEQAAERQAIYRQADVDLERLRRLRREQ
jgi:hypothetical protein